MPAPSLTRLVAVPLAFALATPALLPASATPAAGTVASPAQLQTYERTRPVAPGVTAGSLETFDERGWQQGNTLSVDLTKGARIDYLSPGQVTATKPLDQQANEAGAVAAVNADFFDINNSGAPLGPAVADGQLVKSQSEDPYRAVAFDPQGVGRILEVLFDGTAGPYRLNRLNSPVIRKDEIGAFTTLWGSYSRAHAVAGAAKVTEVVVAGDTVTAVAAAAGAGDIPAGTTILVGREAGADELGRLKVGDRVPVAFAPRASDGSVVRTAVGAHALLVKEGKPQPADDTAYAGRTGLGFSADGKKMVIVSIDSNRLTHSRGATLAEMGRILAARGAYVGVELDGGGSTTLVSRRPGGTKVQVDNVPGDGSVRPVPNGLAVMAPKGSGRVRGLWVETAADGRTAPGDAPVPGGRPDRVFAGTTRTLTATAYDEMYGAVRQTPRIHWSASHGIVRDGVFRALTPGRATVRATTSGGRGSTELEVLGPVQRVTPTSATLNLTTTGSFGLVGFDAHGNSAPVEPADVRLSYDQTLFQVVPTRDGRFELTPKQESGAGVITARIGALETSVAVSVGVEKRILDTFDQAEQWTAGSARAAVSVRKVAEGENGPGLKLSYDFSQSTLTRNAIAISPRPLGGTGQSRAFGVSIHGHGKGEWTALQVVDATGRSTTLYGPYITWNGWQTVELPVPEGLPQPVSLRRVYTLETKAAAQYTGEVVIDNAYVKSAPTVTAPAAPPVRDGLVQTARAVDGRDWRFAVMSDAQFVARDPNSALVQAARRTLREIKAAEPDFFVIAGDFVDEATEADFQLAQRILDEEIGTSVPYYYVPGNHEVMGSAIGNFTKYFGAPHRVFDHQGTRFVTLNTSNGTLRSSGFDQVALLRSALDQAATDRAISSVVLIEHHPPRDPTPAKNSQLADRHEAALVERWLAEFQHETGKGAAFIGGHVGTFHASRVNGVPYLVNGNSGKAPATGADNGGFTGWTLLGVDKVSAGEQAQARWLPHRGGPNWLSAQIRPHVDELTLSAPATLRRGATAQVSAVLTQNGRSVPVAYPVSADWSTSHNVRYDAARGTITATGTGPATLTVKVNGVTETVTLQLTR
ncbi:metallophosphoesterase [Kribbella flavida DSM 17836]|uniref:Metallophosphoesterase n=1 Tax=Kribbella flavida (strain DSM 17836 / JCM 10339 / NBRC 14399) TaxID=479435 RepID=D2PYC0_KRIFD|nr:phosphodiester glycosidase family protein [Kribbella flavida]ADB35488.1 metallophosphoesterase [Kribbella flavida DSM 17836]